MDAIRYLEGRCAARQQDAGSREGLAMHVKQSRFPPGWDEERVRRVLKHYEEQTDAEAIAEDEAAFDDDPETVMQVPRELVPLIRDMIAKHQQ